MSPSEQRAWQKRALYNLARLIGGSLPILVCPFRMDSTVCTSTDGHTLLSMSQFRWTIPVFQGTSTTRCSRSWPVGSHQRISSSPSFQILYLTRTIHSFVFSSPPCVVLPIFMMNTVKEPGILPSPLSSYIRPKKWLVPSKLLRPSGEWREWRFGQVRTFCYSINHLNNSCQILAFVLV